MTVTKYTRKNTTTYSLGYTRTEWFSLDVAVPDDVKDVGEYLEDAINLKLDEVTECSESNGVDFTPTSYNEIPAPDNSYLLITENEIDENNQEPYTFCRMPAV